MIHTMNLWPDSFQAIKKGTKTIEMRLNDEKRRVIKIGDIIEFIDTNTKEKINCVVVNLYHYSNFKELYEYHDKISLGYEVDEVANPLDMLAYYSEEDILKYGVLGIAIQLVA